MSKSPKISLEILTNDAVSQIVEAFKKSDWTTKPTSLFEQYLMEQNEGKQLVWLAYFDSSFAGYVTLKWHSDYQYFIENKIPEICDLNVLPQFIRKGIAAQLISQCEKEVFKKTKVIGIGVGLYADYGSAQIMYIKHGYVPDGKGITYNCQPVPAGNEVKLDDDLILWMTKEL